MFIIDRFIIHVSRSIEYVSPRVNPKVHCGLRVAGPRQFLSCSRCTTLLRDVDNGGDGTVGLGVTWEISVTSPQFCCEHKGALKRIISY